MNRCCWNCYLSCGLAVGVRGQQSTCNYHLVFSLSKFHFILFFTFLSVWQKLEEENQEFFQAYYLRLMLKQQILQFNRLLEQQVELMHISPTVVASLPASNGSHIPAVASLPASNGSHIPSVSSLPTSNGSHMPACKSILRPWILLSSLLG